jgi:hypothetical protein
MAQQLTEEEEPLDGSYLADNETYREEADNPAGCGNPATIVN